MAWLTVYAKLMRLTSCAKAMHGRGAAVAPGIAALRLHIVAMDEQVVHDNAMLHLALCHEGRLARRVEELPKRLHWVLCMRMQHQQACTCMPAALWDSCFASSERHVVEIAPCAHR